MNYVVLDLEWDSAVYPKTGKFINRIIQIGAVKLNDEFDIIDIFERIVKPSFSKKVSKRFSELTGITKEDALSGVTLEEAFLEYNKWVGDNAVTMTWSNSDIYTLLENEKDLLEGISLKIEKYLDLQKYIQGEMRLIGIENNSQISLLNAANALGVYVDEKILHNAKEDSMVCAALLKKCYNKKRFWDMVCDTEATGFFERFTFKPYFITDINDKNIDKSLLLFNCDKCGTPLEIKGRWRFHNRGFLAEMYCSKCNKRFSAGVRFRKLLDTVKVKRRLIEKKPKSHKTDNV